VANLIEVPGSSDAETFIIDLDCVCMTTVNNEKGTDPKKLEVSVSLMNGTLLRLGGSSAKFFLDTYRKTYSTGA